MDKLRGLPTIHFITLEESDDRRTNLLNWFNKYNITNYVPHVFKRFEEYNYELIGPNVNQLAEHSKGPLTSHLTLLKKLYETYDDDYFFIAEDDLSLETIEYWNFTWEDFYNNLPENWNAIQLVIIREYDTNDYFFGVRKDKDWCAAAYLITRKYIKFLLDNYYSGGDVFTLNVDYVPVVENILFDDYVNIYTFPLFVEDCYNTKSTVSSEECYFHNKSHYDAITWWKNIGRNLKMNQMINIKLKHIYEEPQFGENWFTYPTLYKKIVEISPSGSKFVEVGSWKGKSSAFMAVEIANSKKDIEFFCVDIWEENEEYRHEGIKSSLYDVFIENMKPLDKYYTPLKMPSLKAAQKFEDKSLDFVFIDASHQYENVKDDIITWLPKVKNGGIIAGHDYYVAGYDYFPGVKQAVNEIFNVNELIFSEHCWIYNVKI